METELDTNATAVETVDTSVDTEIPETDTSLEAQTTDPAAAQSQTTEEGKPETVSPFSTGKEKFKVNGQEVEWDWNTTKRYAQMGFAANSKFEQAAAIEKKAKETFSQLVQAAQTDPESLIRLLNPSFQGFKKATPAKAGGAEEPRGDEQYDPRDEKIAALEQRLARFEEGLEKQDIAEERKAIEQELEAATKAYPVLNNRINREYVKQQYAAALRKGLDVTMDDVAFHVANEIQMEQQKADQERKAKIEANRKKAPVNHVPGKAGESKPMTREDVMKLAGRIP